MTYTARLNKDKGCKEYKDNQNNVWEYITPVQYKNLPKENKRICADMRKKDSQSIDRTLVNEKESTIGLYEYKPGVKWNERVVGYIPVSIGDEQISTYCVRIVDKSYVKMILYPLFLLLLILTLIVGVFYYTQKDAIPGIDKTAVAYQLDGMENTNPKEIMMPLVPEMQITKGETHIKEMLINPKGNQCYFKFVFLLDDSNEIIYESGYVEPGKAIFDFDLNKKLEVGRHNVTVKIITKDLEDLSKNLNGGDMKTVIEVVE